MFAVTPELYAVPYIGVVIGADAYAAEGFEALIGTPYSVELFVPAVPVCTDVPDEPDDEPGTDTKNVC